MRLKILMDRFESYRPVCQTFT